MSEFFNSLNLSENSKVLDLGCGYAKLWRNNWTDIPKGSQIFGYDLHGTWADSFVEFISEHKSELSEGVKIEVEFMDVETEEAWIHIPDKGKYDCVIAHYINNVLHDRERFFAHVSGVLSDTGMFSFNGAYVNDWNDWLREVFENLGLVSAFLEELTSREVEKRDELKTMLNRYFGTVESVLLPNRWHFMDADDLFEKLLRVYPKQEKILRKAEVLLKTYFADKIAENGEIIVTIRSQFWHCYR